MNRARNDITDIDFDNNMAALDAYPSALSELIRAVNQAFQPYQLTNKSVVISKG